MENSLRIKNMVCPRCIMAVKKVLTDMGLSFYAVELGEVKLRKPMTASEKNTLSEQLKVLGFELLESEKAILISKIKALIIEQVHNTNSQLKVNFSDYLARHTQQDYSTLSRLFSSTEGMTIERFITKQKIERIKELLFYDEKTLAEIAFEMNYSSAAYLSAAFKKETGMTPSSFKKQLNIKRSSIDL